MTIAPFAAGSYVSERTTTSLIGMKSRLDRLTTQLATGRAAESYGGLGAGRTTSLGAHAALGTLDGTISAISGAATRVSLATQSLTQVKTLGDGLRSSLLANLQSTNATGINNSTALAKSNLDAAVDALNQQIDGQYLFSGRATDTEPVVSTDLMLNGNAASGLAGLKTLIAEQKAADLGAQGLGRLTTPSASGTTVSLGEDASAEARANFGFSLVSAASSSTRLSASLTQASPPSVALAFASQPSDGDRVRVAVLQADGSQTILDLTARTSVPAGSTDGFAIGASPAETAANLKTLLNGAQVASVQSASPPGLSATFSGGTPASLALGVGAPAVGDTLTLTLGLHDGTTQTITLTAAASADSTSATSFALGATPEATAANLSAALANALKLSANTALAASSATRASRNFFDGSASPGLAPRRVAADGNGYGETASKGTVIWYRGDDAATDPRATASLQVGANRSVGIGARANESPIRATLAAFGALAAGSATDASGTADVGKFQALAQRAQVLVTPKDGAASVAAIASDFAVASNAMADAKTQAQAEKVTLQGALDGVETVSTEEVAARLLTLQTQLQASYQVTSTLSKLSLVNYLS